ncbi:O-antigen ligase family protein [Clostridiaceae bacterium 35-E11]
MKAKTQKINNYKLNGKQNNIMISYVFDALLLLLFFPPFFKGSFFQKELVPIQIVTSIVFLTYRLMTRNKEVHKKNSWIEVGLLALSGVYIISTFTAVNTNISIQETLKYMHYLCIIILSKRLIDNQRKRKIALTTLVVAGVVVVFIGLGTALEAFQYNGAFTDGMMNSTFQYHNTFGAYCLAILFLAYTLLNEYQGKTKHFIRIATFMLFLGFILSYSRGAWVVMPLVGFMYYLLVSKAYKIGFMSDFIGNLLGVVVIIKPLTTSIEAVNKTPGWFWVFIGMVVSFGVSLFLEKLLKKLDFQEKIYNLFIPMIALVIPMVGLLFKNTLLGMLPTNLAQRLGSISLGTETVTERTVFYKDAFSIIKDYPIFGTGGGGWSTLYRAYQTYGYSSAQAHNYYMQLWIEVGTVGIIIFAGILLAYIYHAFKTYRSCEEPSAKANYATMFTVVMTILIHSAIDFDLTYASIGIIMWSIIGMQLAIGESVEIKEKKVGIKIPYVTTVFACILLVLSMGSSIASHSAKQSVYAIQQNKIEEGIAKFKRASMIAPFDPTYAIDYANLLNNVAYQTKDEDQRKEAIDYMDKAVELGKYDFEILTNAARFYLRNEEMEKAFQVMENLEKYHPLNSNTYENKAGYLLTVAEIYTKKGEKEKAKKLLKEIIEIPNKANQLNEKIKNEVEINQMVRFVEIRPKTQEYVDKAKGMLEELR